MSKFINEENLQFNDKPLSEKYKNANVIANTDKVKIFDSANAKVLSKEEQKTRKRIFDVILKIMVVLNILTNIAFLFFASEVLKGIGYNNGLYYEFNTFRIVGIIIFALAQLTGLYLTIRAFKTANLKLRLILVTAPLAVVLLGGLWALLNVQRLDGAEGAIIQALGLDTFNPAEVKFQYILIAVAVYIILLYVLYGLIFKNAHIDTNKKTKKFKEN